MTVRWMLTGGSVTVRWMLTGGSVTVRWMLTGGSVTVRWMLTGGSVTVRWMLTGGSVTVLRMLPAPLDFVQRTSFGASDISVTVQARVVAWPDITFLSVPVISGGSFHIDYMLLLFVEILAQTERFDQLIP